MKVGDLVTHRLEGRWDEVGIVTNITPCIGIPEGMVEVLWNVECTHRNDHLYRARHLEVVNEGR
jgi:uncharacterized protein YijF (DUF1287 family)